MLFAEEDAPQLKKWIVKRLENTSDADADVLADYVLALLRHDGDIATVRRLCEEEIPDFLKEDSSIFVRDVFDAIHYKSYLPGAPPPPRQSFTPMNLSAAPLVESIPTYGNLGIGVGEGEFTPRGLQNGSRKRSYNDRGETDFQGKRGVQAGGEMNGRAYKQPRRGNLGLGGGFDAQGNAVSAWQNQKSPSLNFPGMPLSGYPNMPPLPSPPSGMHAMDPGNPMSAMLAMQAMGFPVPSMPGFPPSVSPIGQAGSPIGSAAPMNRKRQRCRDYDMKGFCARGNTCMFEHGDDSIYVPPLADEYDPTNSSLMTGIEGSTILNITGSSPAGFQNFRGGDRVRGRSRGDRGSAFGASARGGRRADFSSDRPNLDKTKTTIVVENIPEEKFSEELVREFFTEFGSIIEIHMKPYKRLAIIKYETWDAAKAAYASPKVIFDNRFVKVYWYTDADSVPKPPPSSIGNGTKINGSGTPTPIPARAAEEPQIDLEEFARKQQDFQKVHEEKMKKKGEMEAAQKDLERRQEELLKNQAQERRKLMEKLAAKSGKSSLSTGSGVVSASDENDKPSSQTEALKAQLAALEAEAKSLGIDPTLTEESSWGGRGRGRGRADYRGGTYRGRGAYVPRGRGFDRGGFRGRGGATFGGGGNAYKLDNRPREIAITGIDFTDVDKDESLRQYLLGIGEFTDMEITAERTSITFKDRFTAEKFMYGLPNGEIPSAGKVEMAWVQTPLPPASIAKPVVIIDAENTGDDINDSPMEDVEQNHGRGEERSQERHEELDYDVANDEWGIT